MMARWLYTLVNLLILNLLTKYATASLTAFGTRFLIALPKVDLRQKEKIHFLLGTMAKKIQVKITTNHYDGDQLEASVTLRRSRVTRYVLGDAFTPKTDNAMESFTYEFRGEASFSLTVLMYQLDETASSFLALPLNAWSNKYFFLVAGHNPTFHFVTLEKTELAMVFGGYYAANIFTFQINGQDHTLSDPVEKLKVDSRRSFMISFCSAQNHSNFDEFYVKVQSLEPIGLIAGNCKTSAKQGRCFDSFSRFEGTLEMIFPEALHGTEFIYWIHLNFEMHVLIVGEKNLPVTVGGKSKAINNQHFVLTNVPNSCLITAPKPVLVIMVLNIQCERDISSDLRGDFYYVQLVPNYLFYVFYLWRVPLVNVNNFLSLVVETEFTNTTRLDDSMLHRNVQWMVAANQTTYSVAVFEIESGSHTVRSNVNRKFGCYISGRNKYIGHAHPAGFSNCVHKDEGTGQDVCTGGTDEESFTYGLRESDLHHLAVGFWTEWKGWTCNTKGVKIRTRSCEKRKSCRGMHDDISKEPCKPSAAQKICNRGNVILIKIFTVVMMVNY